MPQVSVAILAGGLSSRMGQDKALLPLGARTVIERVLDRVLPLSDDVTLITNTPERHHHLGTANMLAPHHTYQLAGTVERLATDRPRSKVSQYVLLQSGSVWPILEGSRLTPICR